MTNQGSTTPTPHEDDDPGAIPSPSPTPAPDRTHPDDLMASTGPSAGDTPATTPSQYVVHSPMTDAEAAAGATACHHLLHQADDGHGDGDQEPDTAGAGVPRAVALRLYASHFLSTWNARVFEFGAALFLASAFPGTLLPVSVYCLVRNAGCILLAHPLGRWVGAGHRLRVVRASIVGQRVPVAASCALLLVLQGELGPRGGDGVFAAVVVLAVVEKLCATMNTIAVERDWVVVITEGNEMARRGMNARMRRIDLFCKLMGPLTIALVDMASTEIAIYTTLGMNVASVMIEYCFIEQVYRRVRGLERQCETAAPDEIQPAHLHEEDEGHEQDGRPRSTSSPGSLLRSTVRAALPIDSLPFYFHHPALLASFALSLLYLTVLSFSGQMVTYLVSVGYTSLHVGVARVGSSVFELGATWAAPLLMRRIGVVRTGIWSLAWQMACLAGALGWYFSGADGLGTYGVLSATGLAVGVALSRMGLWSYDLSAQSIIQDEVDDDHRGTFSAVEASFQNLFEMLSYATTIIFSRPDQFQYPVIVSVVAVYVAGGLYAYFVRKRRGHLFHAPPCIHYKA